MATQMSYNRARSTQKIFLNNYWMEIDGHYTFRTLLVVYLNVSILRKYVLLQKKNRSNSYSRRYFCFFSEESDFLWQLLHRRLFPLVFLLSVECHFSFRENLCTMVFDGGFLYLYLYLLCSSYRIKCQYSLLRTLLLFRVGLDQDAALSMKIWK